MTRVLFLGDLEATGFGTVTMDLGRAMLARGIDLRFVSLNDVPELPEPFASRTLGGAASWLTVPRDEAEARAFLEREQKLFTGAVWDDGWAPDAAIVLSDFEGMRQWTNRTLVPRHIPIFHYVPIEGDDLPPRWAEYWRVLRPVACSEFGAEQIAKVTGVRPPMVYHGVETSLFRPVTPMSPLRMPDGRFLRSREECRGIFSQTPLTDRTWLLRTDRNMPRKRYNAMLRALVPVLADFQSVDLVLHCPVADQGGNLLDELSKFPKWVEGRVFLTQRRPEVFYRVPREVMVALYNAADLYVSNCSEGFGLAIAEALACGTPAVGLGYSAVPEVIGPGGVLVDDVELFDNEYDHRWGVAREEAFASAVRRLLLSPHQLRRLGVKGSEHVRRSFSWARAAIAFEALIEEALKGDARVAA